MKESVPRVSRGLEVLRAGPLTTVQDLGRSGWAHLGVPTAGAADRAALTLANRLVGNPETAAALEVTLGGVRARGAVDLVLAVTGAPCPVTIDGRPVPNRAVLALPAGAVLGLDPAPVGVRAYLAVRGGLDLPAVLGSRSSDTLSGLGPPVVTDGTLLPVGTAATSWPVIEVAPGPALSAEIRLRAIRGPRDGVLASGELARLAATAWRVGPRSDRIGLRLVGAALRLRDEADRPSEPVVRGAIQVPPGGEPVLFLADHPVTGGYPVVAVVAEGDVDRAAQARPGQVVRLALEEPPDYS